jgi:hypothetical protein
MLGKLPFLNGTPVGHYKVSLLTGLTTGLSAGGAVFCARWSSTLGINALLLYMKLRAQIVTPFTAAQEINASITVCRNWSVTHSGGSAFAPGAAPNQVMNSIGDVATIIDARSALTASLTNGTVTQDTQQILNLISNQMLAAASAAPDLVEEEWFPVGDFRFPILLRGSAQEGIMVKNTIAQGAAGTVRFALDLEWIEFQANTTPGTLT